MNSIRLRLLFWQAGALVAATLLVGLITYQLAWDGYGRLRDYALEQVAFSILQYGVEPIGSPTDVQFVSQIWDPTGNLKFSSRPELKLPRQQPGLHKLEWLGEEWHIYTLARDEATVQVANTAANRELMFGEISRWLLLPLGVLVGVFGSLLWMTMGEALAPLDAIRTRIDLQDLAHLQPLPRGDYPDEIAPLVVALNGLLARLNNLLVTQRRFVADAAHELRTPLTAIKLQTQLALAAPAAADHTAALVSLQAGVDRAAHLVDQLLQLARLDPQSAPPALAPCRLDALARELVIEFSPLAEEQGIDLGLGHCDAAVVQGARDSLRIMLGNLIDNALRYAGAGRRVDVEVRAAPAGGATLWVIDNGTGIPAQAREEVFERFHRLASAEIPGSGLGLAIVKEVIARHSGAITLLDTPGGGLSVRVELPGENTPRA